MDKDLTIQSNALKCAKRGGMSLFMQAITGLDKPTRSIFKAGIKENIILQSLKVNEPYDALDLCFRDEGSNMNFSRIYASKKEFYHGDEEAYDRAYTNRLRAVYSLLNTAFYPETCNPVLIDDNE